MRVTVKDRESAKERLRTIVQPGDTLYTVLRHVSRSGMSRAIDVYLMRGTGDPHWLSRLVGEATGTAFNDKRECLRVDGCGMDMGFHVVHNLSYALHPDGFGCVGEGCPSNEHSNGDRDYTRHCDGSHTEDCVGCGSGHSHWHKTGGYSLKQRWL